MMNSENFKKGFIKLYHSMLNWEWFDDANTFRLFIYCLLSANIKTEKWHGVEIQRGQLLTGRSKLARALKISEREIRTAISHLQSTNEVTIKSTHQYSIITVNNYNFYNPNDQQDVQQSTNDRPTTDQRPTTNKDTLINNSISSSVQKNKKTTPEKKFIKPTLEEVKNYISEKNLTIDPERFFYYYEANGWTQGSKKMKSWQAAVQYWQRTEKKEQKETESWSDYVDRMFGESKK